MGVVVNPVFDLKDQYNAMKDEINVRCPHRAYRDELKSYLAERGVGMAIHYPVPIHLQEAYRDLGYRRGDFPVTEACADEILSLPMYPELREDVVREIVKLVKDYDEQYRAIRFSD